MNKVDYKKEYKHLYQPGRTFEVVDVPEMNFLMIDGHGDPNTSSDYSQAVSALYSLAYTIKFMVKKELGVDYGVMPLEGLWWAEDMNVFLQGDKDAWEWTMMIMQPEMVTAEIVRRALDQARKKKPLPELEKIRFEPFHEGLAVQILYTGPYSDEAETLKKMHHEFIPQNGFEMRGKHHEIYLNDPSRTAPEKLKTVLRQPVRRKDADGS